MAFMYCDNCERELDEPEVDCLIDGWHCIHCGHDHDDKNPYREGHFIIELSNQLKELKEEFEAYKKANPPPEKLKKCTNGHLVDQDNLNFDGNCLCGASLNKAAKP